MSSNYRILVYFLSTLSDSFRIGLGLRNTRNFYNRLSYSAQRDQIRQAKRSNGNGTGSSVHRGPARSGLNSKSKNANAATVLDNLSIVAEGLRQYANYTATHALKGRSINQSRTLPNNRIEPLRAVPIPIRVQPEENVSQTRTHSTPVSNAIPSETSTSFQPSNTSNDQAAVRGNGEKKPKVTPPDHLSSKSSLYSQSQQARLAANAKESKIPSNRASRVLSFGGLALSLGIGAVEEFTKRVVGASSAKNNDSILGSSLFLSEANAHKIVDTLCRVRGAALKLGQMLSIQDSEVVGPEIQAIFERVRQSADYMPVSQMQQVMNQELGTEWRALFSGFEEKPFAAASIGQVHSAQLPDGTQVAVKIQYPGVAESIESDIKNVLAILKYANIFPEGLFIDHIMAYAKKELSWEVDYVREANCARTYRSLVQKHCHPDDRFYVPLVYDQLSARRVLTTELIKGISIDKLDSYRETSDQAVKNSILQRLLKLFFQELFVFNYMQTDPNWSNFFYDFETDTISLIDFGSSRPYSREFVNQYYDIIQAAIDNDREKVLSRSREIGFLSGYEAEAFKRAHVDSVMIIGESIRERGKFNFGQQSVTKRIHSLVPVMLRHRLKPPPEEIYSLHRKLSGLFLLFTKLKAEINCRDMFEETTVGYSK